jgi:ABC-type uncharacterized transport system fused permease/ATPase subunit
MTTSTKPILPRRPLRLVDVILGIVASVISLIVFAVILFGLVPYVPKTAGLVLAIVTVVLWVAGESLFIRAATRRRLSFYWPLAGTIAMIIGTNLVLIIASGKA